MIRQLLLISLFIAVLAQWDFRRITEQEAKQITVRRCGENLNDLLRSICGGVYNSPDKKSSYDLLSYDDPYPDYNMLDNSEQSGLDYNRFVFQPKAQAMSILQYKRLKRGGVYDECCVKSCTLYQIRAYCRV